MTPRFTSALADATAPEFEPFAPATGPALAGFEGAMDFQGLISQALNRLPAGAEESGAANPPFYSDSPCGADENSDFNGMGNSNPYLRSAKSSSSKQSDSKRVPHSDQDKNSATATSNNPAEANPAAQAQPAAPPADEGNAQTGAEGGQASQKPATGVTAGQAGGASSTAAVAGFLAGQPLNLLATVSGGPAGKDNSSAPAANPAANGNSAVAEPGNINTQAIDNQKLMISKADASGRPPPDGMTGAFNQEHMKFGAEKNEIAGDTEQKVPRLAEVDHGGSGFAHDGGTSHGHDFSGSGREPDALISGIEFSVHPGLMETPRTGFAVGGSGDAAAQVDRVTQLVSQEAVTVRQMGATSLAVSLKLDPHTELFLQLTNQDGQIQASLRCERGNIDGLNNHWGQLQESLAKQNIQLLPPAGTSGNSGSPQFSHGSESRRFDQPSQSPQRQAHETSAPVNDTTAKPARARAGKTLKSGRQGWESWA